MSSPTAAIAGIGQTEFSRNSGRSELVLALEAALAAVVDAGITVSDIDGIVRYQKDTTEEAHLVAALNLPDIRYFGQVGYGGSGSCGVIAHAAAAVGAGQATHVLCHRSLNGRSGTRFGQGSHYIDTVDAACGIARSDITVGSPLTGPYGLLTPGHQMAMWTRRYAHAHGLSDDEIAHMLGAVAVSQRELAQRNPNALMRGKTLTLDQYLESPPLADPLRLYDFCLETDGAVAAIVTTADRARDLRRTPVEVAATQQHLSPYSEPLHLYKDDLASFLPSPVATRLFEEAAVSPNDIDVAEIYDASTVMVPFVLEDFEFCERGGAAAFLEAGEHTIGGALPINTHGGLLSEGYINGFNTVTEAVRQLRGSAANQVQGARHAFVTAAGASSLILRRA